MRDLEILSAGMLTTIQDLGRPGLAALGIGRSGAADRASLRLGNRLLGNTEMAAGLEMTMGGLAARLRGGVLVAVTGAVCPVVVDGRAQGCNVPVYVPDGGETRIGYPTVGVRSYLCVRGGIDVPMAFGSRSSDLMAGLGPSPVRAGDLLPVGALQGPYPAAGLAAADVAAAWGPSPGEITVRVMRGPRDDWFAPRAWDRLTRFPYEVTTDSNRVGMRLRGPVLERARRDELPSEGTVCGALQVPPSGLPTLFLADHPVTGGYPVIATVVSADIPRIAQARPGQQIRFRAVGTPWDSHRGS